MARRRSSLSRKKLLEQALKKGLDDLKSTRATLKEAERLATEGVSYRGAALKKIPAVDYRRMLSLEKKFGLYDPTGSELTPSRKRSIRQHFIQLEHLVKESVFAEFPQGSSAKKKREIIGDLRKAYPTAPASSSYFSGAKVRPRRRQLASKKGIWLPKAARQISAPIGQLKYDKDAGVYAVQVTKKTKSGLLASEMRYIAGSDILEKKQDRLQRRFDRLRPLRKNQRLRFIIGRNESRRTFRTMRELFKYAENYRSDAQARATFLNELLIEVVEKGTPRKKWVGRRNNRKLVSDPWSKRSDVFRASNLRSVDPDIVAEMIEEMGDDAEE